MPVKEGRRGGRERQWEEEPGKRKLREKEVVSGEGRWSWRL